VNLTVWESVEALREFAYRGLHRDFFRRRGDWFQPGVSGAVMWWIPSGTLPTVDDACRRLDFLRSFGPSPYAFGTGQRPAPLVIVPREIGHPDVVPMIERLNRELIDTEPEGGICHLSLDHEELLPGDGAFFAAYLDGAPRACGAYRRIDDASAEVKRMWADPAVRGSKLGAAVLSTIVGAALADGYRELRLETGEHLTAAVGLYTKVGFTACEPWGEYKCSPSSHCMSMRLTAEPFRQG
jgi:GNAT superfamily N-acetyltransferase